MNTIANIHPPIMKPMKVNGILTHTPLVILAPILIALLCAAVGWKLTFLIIGILAPLWIIPWLWLRKKGPKEHPNITDEEREYIITGQPECRVTNDKGLSWGQLLSRRKSYAVILSRFFLDPIWWMFVTWLPIYLGQKYGMDLKALATYMWIPYVGAALGSIAGGWVSGRMVSAGSYRYRGCDHVARTHLCRFCSRSARGCTGDVCHPVRLSVHHEQYPDSGE